MYVLVLVLCPQNFPGQSREGGHSILLLCSHRVNYNKIMVLSVALATYVAQILIFQMPLYSHRLIQLLMCVVHIRVWLRNVNHMTYDQPPLGFGGLKGLLARLLLVSYLAWILKKQ